jgi:hypothetical protein
MLLTIDQQYGSPPKYEGRYQTALSILREEDWGDVQGGEGLAIVFTRNHNEVEKEV